MSALSATSDSRSPTAITLKLFAYCRSQNWAGYDPYDALNSHLFRTSGLHHFKYPRLALTQFLKRCPINLRPLLLVPKEQNPKGIALFLSAAVKLQEAGLLPEADTIQTLSQTLIGHASIQNDHVGWGYHFDWQTRGALVPRGSPNIVCTSFAAHALLDARQFHPDPHLLDLATAAARFLLDQLYRETNGSEACFSYFPNTRTQVHNANLLGAALLCRVARETGDPAWLAPALKAACFSAEKQRTDGSWVYGEAPTQQWVDNFHTGFNLCALYSIARDAETTQFDAHIQHGFEFYRRHFFTAAGAPPYFHDRLYPLDIHSAAQSVITLVTLRDSSPDNLRLADQNLAWVLSNMWNPQGYFYYQKHPHWTNRIPYMRWSQAWMLLALATLAKTREEEQPVSGLSANQTR